MKKNEEKTNVIRILEQNKINFKVYNYINSTAISGTEVADYLGEDYNIVFKTLVTIGKSGNHYVFLVPVNKELDLKKAAIVVEEKSIEMIKSKELLPLTGYIHGGCSPVGMKKNFTTIIDKSAKQKYTIRLFMQNVQGKNIYRLVYEFNNPNSVGKQSRTACRHATDGEEISSCSSNHC